MTDRNELASAAEERPHSQDGEGHLPESDPGASNEDDLEGGFPEDGSEDSEAGDEDELEKARVHADPTRGDREVEGGDRVSTEEGGNPQE